MWTGVEESDAWGEFHFVDHQAEAMDMIRHDLRVDKGLFEDPSRIEGVKSFSAMLQDEKVGMVRDARNAMAEAAFCGAMTIQAPFASHARLPSHDS